MAWSTPKTDWFGAVAFGGNYTGDRFNAADFNRIKNNLVCLWEMAAELHKSFDIADMGADRSPSDYFYADEINLMERNLNTINANTFRRSYGTAPVYIDNGATPDFIELNRLESAILDLYNRFINEAEDRRTFTWNLGTKGGRL